MPGVASAPSFRVVHTASFRANAKTWANQFEARLLEPGLVSYADVGGPMSMLPREAIARSARTFVGKPLIDVRNKKGLGVHKKVTPATLEGDAVGYISDVYEGPDGWWWCRGIVFDDDAKDAIKSKGFCSCGYHVEAAGPGGEHHAIRYDETITQFSGEHLAIVDRPRYEGATIRLNSKAAQKNTHMNLKFWKKPAAPVESPAAPTTPTAPAAVQPDKTNALAAEDITAETEFEFAGPDGKPTKVALSALIDAHNARENGLDPEAEIEVDGKPVKVSAVIDGYKANAKAAPAAPVVPAPAAPAKASHFRVVLNARNNAAAVAPTGGSVDSLDERLARGNSLYGSKKPAADAATN